MKIEIFKNILTTCFVLALMSGTCFAEEVDIAVTSYAELIKVQADGSAEVTTRVVPTANQTNTHEIPWMFPEVSDLNATNSGTSLETKLIKREGLTYLQVENPPTGEYSIEFTVPEFLNWEEAGPEEFKAYELRYEFRNSVQKSVEHYSMEIVLPQGWNFHRVLGSMPPMKPKDTYPPYSFMKDENGLAHLSLKSSSLSLGDACWIEFSFKQSNSSMMLIIVGVILSILYLWFFRHILAEAKEVAREQKKKA